MSKPEYKNVSASVRQRLFNLAQSSGRAFQEVMQYYMMERFITRAMAKEQVFEYIDVYYNRKRLHSSLGYCSPLMFEERLVA